MLLQLVVFWLVYVLIAERVINHSVKRSSYHAYVWRSLDQVVYYTFLYPTYYSAFILLFLVVGARPGLLLHSCFVGEIMNGLVD